MDPKFFAMILGSVARHGATTFAGYLVANGFADKSQSEQIVGGILAGVAVAWSWWQKSGHAQTEALLSRVAPKAVLLIVAGLLAFAPQARAADANGNPVMTTAAQPASCAPSACTGFYVGGNLSGVMTNANVVGAGIGGSLAGGGQNIGVNGGWQYADGKWFLAAELSADYTVLGNPNVTGGSPPKYLLQEGVKLGTSLTSLLNIQSPSASPSVPAQLAASVISPYLYFGAAERSWGAGWATGAGVEFSLTGNLFLDTRYTYINYGSASVSLTQNTNGENMVAIGINWKF